VESRCSACLPQRSTAALRSLPHLNRAARAPPAQRVRASTNLAQKQPFCSHLITPFAVEAVRSCRFDIRQHAVLFSIGEPPFACR
jgi:hypothetical protein